MITRHLLRITAVLALAAGTLVACGDDAPACAAPAPRPVAGPTYKPQPRHTYKPPRPRQQDTRPPISKPKKTKTHTWGQPYRKGAPVAPQPTVTRYRDREVRVYPGYPGYYPVGVWPIGYGAAYGCHAHEGEPVDDDD